MACSDYLLFLACESNNPELIKECITNGYSVNARTITGETPLMKLLQHRHPDETLTSVKLLVEYGANPSAVDHDGRDVFTRARHEPTITDFLITSGISAPSPPAEVTSSSTTDLKASIKHGQKLTTLTTAEVNKCDSEGFSPFMWSIWYENLVHFNHYLYFLGADVNAKTADGRTPLMLACYKFNFDIIKELLERGADVNETDSSGNPTVAYLVMNWRVYTPLEREVFEYVVENGADLSLCGPGGKRVFIWAALHKMIASLLVEEKRYNKITKTFTSEWVFVHGRDIELNQCDNEGNTALGYVAFQGWVDVANSLFGLSEALKLDFCNKKGRTPLAWAITGNNLKMCEFLVEKGAQVNYVDFNGLTALSYARKYERSEIVAFLLKNGAIELHEHPLSMAIRSNSTENFLAFVERRSLITKLETTPLRFAISEERPDLVKLLVERGANVCQKDKNGNTPLIYAIHVGNTGIIEYLLENGAKPTIYSAFCTALETQKIGIVKLLIENGAKVNKIYGVRGSPLVQAIRMKSESLFGLLLEVGASPNYKEEPSPLTTAVRLKDVGFVRRLIDNGAAADGGVDELPLPLQLACKLEHFEIVKLLVENGANVNLVHKFPSPLRIAVTFNNVEMARYLVEKGAVVCEESSGKPLLQIAIEHENSELVRVLVEENNQDVLRKSYVSPLRAAVEVNNFELVRYLVEKGVDVNHPREAKETVLQMAIQKQDFPLVMYLLQKGADVDRNHYEIKKYAQADVDFDEFYSHFQPKTPIVKMHDDVIIKEERSDTPDFVTEEVVNSVFPANDVANGLVERRVDG